MTMTSSFKQCAGKISVPRFNSPVSIPICRVLGADFTMEPIAVRFGRWRLKWWMLFIPQPAGG